MLDVFRSAGLHERSCLSKLVLALLDALTASEQGFSMATLVDIVNLGGSIRSEHDIV